VELLEGRTLLSSIPTADSRPDNFFEFDGHVYFAANDGIHGQELWRTDGTEAGTTLVKDLTPGVGSSEISPPVEFSGEMYFFVYRPYSPGRLWKSDGTSGGTVPVTDPGYVSTLAPVVFNGSMYFAGGGPDGVGLYQSDGTAAGTTRVAALKSISYLFRAPDGLVIFANRDSYTRAGETVFVSDGNTIVNTQIYADYFTSYGSVKTAEFDGALYVSMYLPHSAGVVFRTDGTIGGTSFIASGHAEAMTARGDEILMHISSSYTSGAALWSSDGTQAVKYFEFGHDTGASPDGMFALGQRAVFVTGPFSDEQSNFGYDLWTTDGTAAGTSTIGISDPANVEYIALIASAGQHAYFQVLRHDSFKAELWQTDGTAAGTHLIRGGLDIGYTSLGLIPMVPPGIRFGQNLLFIANDEATGFEPCSSDGTGANTHVVRDINALPQLDTPALAANVPRYQDGPTTYVGPRPTFTGAAPDGATVVLFDFYGEIGRGVAHGGVYTVTPDQPIEHNSVTVSAVVAAANGDASQPTWPARNAIYLGIDGDAPRVQSPIQFNDSAPHRLTLAFSEDVAASLSTEDVVIQNAETGQLISPSAMSITFSPGFVANITFPGFANGRLPRGTYRLTIARQDVTDRVGNILMQDVDFSWTVRRIGPLVGNQLRSAVELGRPTFAAPSIHKSAGGLYEVLELEAI
jgi:ELWxxDGT repeat protein